MDAEYGPVLKNEVGFDHLFGETFFTAFLFFLAFLDVEDFAVVYFLKKWYNHDTGANHLLLQYFLNLCRRCKLDVQKRK